MVTINTGHSEYEVPDGFFQTEKFLDKFIQEVKVLKLLTPGQYDGLLRGFQEAESMYLATLPTMVGEQEYDDILKAQETFEALEAEP